MKKTSLTAAVLMALTLAVAAPAPAAAVPYPRIVSVVLHPLVGALQAGSRGLALLVNGERLVRTWTIHYRAHDGAVRTAYVVLPVRYGPHIDPPIPLVISPHGRGVGALHNARLWGDRPALGTFAVLSAEAHGHGLASRA